MTRFQDERTREVYAVGYHAGLQKKVAASASKTMRLLCAARSLQDVGVIGPIYRLRLGGRFGLLVEGRWFVTFRWDEDIGAANLLLERLKGS